MHRVLLLTLLLVACAGEPAPPAELTPAVPIGEPQIPYPPDLFAERVEGEVLLYVVVDTNGMAIRDSTRVATSSGRAAFDAAALQAAPSLRFTPARIGDSLVVAPLQVPVRFVLPDSTTASVN
jgi:TonB family protein